MPEANLSLSPADPAAPPPVPPKRAAPRDAAETEESSLAEYVPDFTTPASASTATAGFEQEDEAEILDAPPAAPSAAEDDLASILADDEIPPVTPEPPSVESLMAEVERLKASVTGQQPPAGQTPAAPVAPAAAEAPATPEPEVFVTEEAYEEILGSHDKFNGFLRDFKQKTQVEAVQAAHAIVMPQVAQMAAAIAANIVSTHSTVEKFYAANPDLAENREHVGKVYQALLSKYPDWPVEKLVAATAQVARKAKARAQTQTAVPRTAPPNVVPMAPPTGARPAVAPRQRLDSLAAELAAVKL